jgi:hypothetical protein
MNEREKFIKMTITNIKANNGNLEWEIGYIDEEIGLTYFYPYNYFTDEEIKEMIEKYTNNYNSHQK